jgi:hypothetical protein
MKKQSVILGVACAGFLLAVLANRSDAHWVPTLSGWSYHSLACTIVLKSIPKQGVGGSIECSLPGTVATVFCENPGGFRFAGKAAISSISSQEPIPGDAGGASKSGKGTYTATLNVFDPVLSEFQFACPGQGDWRVVAVVITTFEGHIIVRDAEGDIASQVVANCEIPPQFQNSIPPAGTQYICNVLAEHVS